MKELKLLLWKNFKVLSREKLSTLAEILAPLSCIVVFGIFRIILKSQAHPEPAIWESFAVNDIPVTVKEQADILLYTPSNPKTDAIMEMVLKNFFQGEDFNYTIKGFARENQMVEAYLKGRDKDEDVFSRGPVLAGIVFQKIGPKKIPSQIKYALRFPSYQRTNYSEFTDRTNCRAAWFTENIYPILRFSGPRSKDNQYGGFPGYFEEGFLYLQHALDNSITRLLLNETQVQEYTNSSFRMQRFPYPPYAHDKYLVVSLVWTPYLFGVAYIYSIMNLTRLIIHEKVTRIKEFMKIMGLANWQHWMSWFIRSFTLAVIVALLSTFVFKVEFGKNLSVYPYSNPLLLFLCLFLYGMTAITFSFLFSTIFSNVDAGATIAGFSWIVFIFPFFGYFSKFSTLVLPVYGLVLDWEVT
ncbi:unnamed protein product [Allacma fusca]|uniref:ABC-2 type transporter transmembrane domain-containing protein n=1 Tax=Allacma fusca TaxID=39272 RepID=A0A8J2MDC2_9HEXA|nr:unnamed protein product [Allacma fusca]